MPDEMNVSDIGEFGLIDRIRRLLGDSAAVVGIGDDAAVLEMPGPDYLLATVDMLVEGVHFRFETTKPNDVGFRALAVNASDVAAMGGRPTFALISLAVPVDLEVEKVERLYLGMKSLATDLHIGIIGGNLTRTSGPLCVDVMLLGTVPKDSVVRRGGAAPGDLLAVTGTLGDAMAVRQLGRLTHAQRLAYAGYSTHHAIPTPRVEGGQALARSHIATAMLDISDGLAGDLPHILNGGKVGACIEQSRLPISRETREIAALLGDDPVDWALYGGEDYELLVALRPDRLSEAQKLLAPVQLIPVGSVTASEMGAQIVNDEGIARPLADRGWKHF